MLLTMRDAAERLQISTKTLRRIISRGELPVVRLGTNGKSDRIDEVALTNYIKRRTTFLGEPRCRSGNTAIRIAPGSCGKAGSLREWLERSRKQKSSKRKPAQSPASRELRSG
jgi:excisionase family DNA binding protein